MFARSPQFIGKLATEIGSNALAIPTDISNPKDVAAAFHKVRQQLGPVEILIANASGSVGEGLMETSPEQFERTWRTGVYGAFVCAREAVLDMLELRTGAIIFTGATSSVRGRGETQHVDGTPGGVAIADFNQDGRLDIATPYNNGTASILLQNSIGGFSPRH
jgi:NAD(P)-dependent dehydrogenase (short-subunit alcohol dehydrogenase family)